MIAAMTNLFIVEGAKILCARMLQRVVMRVIGLNQHAARQITATRAPGDLSYQLKGSFGGTEIRQGQTGIDGDDAHESHVVKVVSFRQHLRADQQVDFAFAEIKQVLFKFVAARFRVAIDAAEAQIRKAFA